MTEHLPLTISFGEDSAAPATDLVLLEQEPEGAYAGRLTKLGAARYLDWALYATAGAPAPNVVGCGGAPGNLDTALLVWPLLDDVRYQLFATIGNLGAASLGEVEETDTVSFTLTTTASIKHPARRVLSAKWLTGPWTTGGLKIEPPPLFVHGRELRTNLPVYGSVRVRYAARRYRHPLRIPWREAEPSLAADSWSEWAVCLPAEGRPVALAISANRGAADMAKSGKDCGRGGGISIRIKGPEEQWPPTAEAEDRVLDCEYCTGKCEEE